MSIDQNILLQLKIPYEIVFDRPYPHHVPFLLVSGRQQALDKKRIMNMLVTLIMFAYSHLLSGLAISQLQKYDDCCSIVPLHLLTTL